MSRAKNFALLLVTFLILLSPVVAQTQKQTKPEKPVREYTIEQFMNTTRVLGSSFSSDEKSILFSSNKTGIFNAYSVAVTGGAPSQLTNSTKESTFYRNCQTA